MKEIGNKEYKNIFKTEKKKKKAKLMRITDSETGKSITCTPDHKVYTSNRGYVKAAELLPDDKLVIN